MEFYERYTQLCKEHGLGKTTAAQKIDVSKSTASDWGKGNKPSMDTIIKLADLFGVSTDYLLGNTDIKNPPEQQSPEEVAKVALFGGDSEVTEEMWQEVKDYVEFIKAKHKKD